MFVLTSFSSMVSEEPQAHNLNISNLNRNVTFIYEAFLNEKINYLSYYNHNLLE